MPENIDAVRQEIPRDFLLVPPDGGDVKTSEAVRAMADEITRLRAEVKRLRAALEDCVETLALVERPALKDPAYGEAVEQLGERIGYGALMSSASASWRESAKRKGYPTGGEFVAGPCFATVVGTLRRAREAMGEGQ